VKTLFAGPRQNLACCPKTGRVLRSCDRFVLKNEFYFFSLGFHSHLKRRAAGGVESRGEWKRELERTRVGEVDYGFLGPEF